MLWSWALSLVSLAGLWATGSKHRWGWIVGFISEFPWIVYGQASHQYGFIVMSAIFAVVHIRNWLKWGSLRTAMKLCHCDKHLLVTVYYRPWRRLFRKRRIIRCWKCDLQVFEP
jgi:hypothetical protein